MTHLAIFPPSAGAPVSLTGAPVPSTGPPAAFTSPPAPPASVPAAFAAPVSPASPPVACGSAPAGGKRREEPPFPLILGGLLAWSGWGGALPLASPPALPLPSPEFPPVLPGTPGAGAPLLAALIKEAPAAKAPVAGALVTEAPVAEAPAPEVEATGGRAASSVFVSRESACREPLLTEAQACGAEEQTCGAAGQVRGVEERARGAEGPVPGARVRVAAVASETRSPLPSKVAAAGPEPVEASLPATRSSAPDGKPAVGESASPERIGREAGEGQVGKPGPREGEGQVGFLSLEPGSESQRFTHPGTARSPADARQDPSLPQVGREEPAEGRVPAPAPERRAPEVRLEVDGGDWGKVTVRVAERHGTVAAKFLVQEEAARVLLERKLPELQFRFEQTGLAAGELTVDLEDVRYQELPGRGYREEPDSCRSWYPAAEGAGALSGCQGTGIGRSPPTALWGRAELLDLWM